MSSEPIPSNSVAQPEAIEAASKPPRSRRRIFAWYVLVPGVALLFYAGLYKLLTS